MALAWIARIERDVPFYASADIVELQSYRVRELARHAYATVPFYRQAMDERGLRPEDIQTAADLSELPLIDGADLARDTPRFVSAPFKARGREVFNTSGSTSGVRKPILWDHASLVLRAARAERDRVVIARLAGESWRRAVAREFLVNERRHTIARLLGIGTLDHQRLQILPADFSSRTQRAIWSERSVIPRRPVHYHHLPPTVPLDVAAAQIAAIRPRIVWSFGSYADQFFRFVNSSKKAIPLPRLWVYLGDTLSSEGRDLGESMGCRVYSVYGAMEAGTIGFQCEERDGFHLNIDLCALRLVDAGGRDVDPGETGDVVISVLDNRGMALLNYRLGDRAVLSPDPCRCGRSLPLLTRLEGRRSEVVSLADGRELSSLTLEALFGAELRRTIAAQMEQKDKGHLCWTIVPAAGVDYEELRDAILLRARHVLGVSTMLTISFVEEIPRTRIGKFVRVRPTPAGARDGAR